MMSGGNDWFSAELQFMMFALGDSRRPNLESVSLMESLIFKQLTTLVLAAQDIVEYTANNKEETDDRKKEGVDVEFTGEELIFLLRKDELLMKRLVNYLKAKDMNSKIGIAANMPETSRVEGPDDADFLAEEPVAEKVTGTKESKRVRLLRRAFERFDVTGEYLQMLEEDVDDPLKHMRMIKIHQRTSAMDAGEYLRFSEARQTSFCPRTNHRKFREWIFGRQSPCHHCRPDHSAMEILNFVAYETLATLMDFAVIVKEESNAKSAPDHLRVRMTESPVIPRTNVSSNSPHVAMALARKVRENQLTTAGSGPKYLKVGIDALQASTILPEEIREAVRRMKCHRNNFLFPLNVSDNVFG